MDEQDRLDHYVAQVVGVRLDVQRRWSDGEWQPGYYLYDHTIPVLADGRVRPRTCPLPQSGSGMWFGLVYEWSDSHQAAFEVILNQYLDRPRLDALVTSLGPHWINAGYRFTALSADQVDYVEYWEMVAPGVSARLRDLGKTKEFRVLRSLELYTDSAREAAVLPPVLNDQQFERGAKGLRSEYRPDYIGARAAIEFYSREYGRIPDYEEMACPICADVFWPQALDARQVTRFGRPRYCSQCLRMTAKDGWVAVEVTRDQLVDIAHLVHGITGAIPHPSMKDTDIAGLEDGQRDTWVKALMVLPGMASVGEKFGSWAEYLAAADLLHLVPRGPFSGYVSQARDGHIALSLGERLVCDWLHTHGIDHQKEPLYPVHPELNKGGKLRGDWLIGDCWVELAGRMGDSKYERQIARKRQLAGELGLRHLVLLPNELRAIDVVAAEHWGYSAR
jgi:hypothetical protein